MTNILRETIGKAAVKVKKSPFSETFLSQLEEKITTTLSLF